MKNEADVRALVEALEREYPDAECSLDYGKDWQLLFSVRLAAQCTDARVNLVTPALFAALPTLEDFAAAELTQVEALIRSCGFYHTKARDLIACAQLLLTRHGGVVPDNMEELLALPGVGRKTANLILGDIYHQPGAVVTDTHCIRIANKLGLANSKDPAKVEIQLRQQLPADRSNDFCHRLVLHGRAVCSARSPRCEVCCLAPWCDEFSGRSAADGK